MIWRRRGARRVDPVLARRRWRRWGVALVIGGGCALAFMAISAGLVRLPERDFAIRTVRIESTFERVRRQDIAAVVAPYAASGFFQVDLKAIRESLVAMPWIRSAAVRRVWPDTLYIAVVEEKPVARWGGSGLVNEQGEVFYPDDAERIGGGLPLLEGPPHAAKAVLVYYRAVTDQLAPLGLGVARLSVDARRARELTLSNGLHLTLGRRDADGQLRRFIHFYPAVMAGRTADIAAVDLRYTNGFALRWRPAAAQPQAAKKRGDAV
jgi:cell division protein FtsQ